MFRINDVIQFKGKDYELVSFLGNGGMGQVFLIKEQNSNNQLAMKTLTNFLPDDENYRSLINEWELAQSIRHENVISYRGFDDGAVFKTPYLIMDLAEDGSLQDFLNIQEKMLDEQSCLNIFHQIIDGMEAINKVLVHRDIKPDNIFIDNGVFKIADFGLAKIIQDKTRSKTFKGWGTAPYTAPEAYRFEKNTIQMDMYSIGLVFFQTAGKEHALGTPKDWEKAHLTTVPTALNKVNNKISPKVASVVNKLIEKKPKDRYQSWDEVRKDLQAAASNIGNHKNSINKLLDKKLLKDLELKKSESEKLLKEDELLRRKGIVSYQFEKSLKTPLTELLYQLNETVLPAEMAVITDNSTKDLYEINFSFDKKEVSIWFSAIDQSDELSLSIFKGLTEKNTFKLDLSKPLTPFIRGNLLGAV